MTFGMKFIKRITEQKSSAMNEITQGESNVFVKICTLQVLDFTIILTAKCIQ